MRSFVFILSDIHAHNKADPTIYTNYKRAYGQSKASLPGSYAITCRQPHQNRMGVLPLSNCASSFRSTSILNSRYARSMRSRLAASWPMLRDADHVPVSKPSSPPTMVQPSPKKKYVAKSPNLVGLRYGVMSGMDSGLLSFSSWCLLWCSCIYV